MRRTGFELRLGALAAIATLAGWLCSAVSAADLVIANVALISPERAEPLAGATVHIVDGRIVAVGQNVTGNAAVGEVLDASGLYLVPGLMDSHLHTTFIPSLGFADLARAGERPAMAAAYETQLPRSLLYFGITQLLDPAASPAGLRRLLAVDTRPDVFHCGPAPVVGGYPLNQLGAELPPDAFPYTIDEPGTGRTLPAGLDPAKHTPEAVVERMRADGALCVKLFFEDGWDLRSDWPLVQQETARRVVARAHALGMPVLAHANALDMQALAVDAGVDVLAHGLWNWNQHRGESGLPADIRTHLKRVISRGVAFQPTFRVMDGIREMFAPATLNAAALHKVVPAELLAWYREPAAQWFARSLAEDDFDGMPDSRIRALVGGPVSQGERAVQFLTQQGHPLLLASDHPANPGHANHPGYSTYLELEHMTSLDLPLSAVLAAATINNARAFGLADDYGTVEVGKVANLVLLKENPLDAVSAYDTIEWVVLRGRPLRRESLAADAAQ